MALDKWIALVFLVIALIYGYASFTYALLPFERNMVFVPNTLPNVLSVIAAFLALILLLSPKPKVEGDVLGDIDIAQLRQYKVGQALGLLAAMVLYALALRPVGFIASTTIFLAGTGWILGERKLHVMVPVALLGAGAIWYLVQEALGIFLRPLPWFFS